MSLAGLLQQSAVVRGRPSACVPIVAELVTQADRLLLLSDVIVRLRAMITRPTEEWARLVQDQRRRITAGTLAEDDAYALDLWPEAFIAAVDTALDAYEADVRSFLSPSDDKVFASIERVVMALNAIDEEHGSRIETGEREELCEYIGAVLTGAGIDVDRIASRRNIDRAELTDEWRDW